MEAILEHLVRMSQQGAVVTMVRDEAGNCTAQAVFDDLEVQIIDDCIVLQAHGDGLHAVAVVITLERFNGITNAVTRLQKLQEEA